MLETETGGVTVV